MIQKRKKSPKNTQPEMAVVELTPYGGTITDDKAQVTGDETTDGYYVGEGSSVKFVGGKQPEKVQTANSQTLASERITDEAKADPERQFRSARRK